MTIKNFTFRDAKLGLLHRLSPMIKSDRLYLSLRYRIMMDRKIHWDNPITFNEKLQWLKLYNRKDLYTNLVDKFAVKDYVRGLIGDEYVVPCYGVWSNANLRDFDQLPNQFVLKTTHESSGVVVCKDKKHFDRGSAIKSINSSLNLSLYHLTREWPDKNVSPKVIADKYLDDGRKGELQDYKFWCFNGQPIIMYITNKGQEVFENFYDMDFNPLNNINHGFPRFLPEYSKPDNFELMKKLAAILSQGIPFVRINFFDVNGHVYFGEFTFFDWAGFRPFSNDETDIQLGKLIKLP